MPWYSVRHSWLRVFTPNCWKCRVANILSPSQGRSIKDEQEEKNISIDTLAQRNRSEIPIKNMSLRKLFHLYDE